MLRLRAYGGRWATMEEGGQDGTLECKKRRHAPSAGSQTCCSILPKLPAGRAEAPIVMACSEHAVGGRYLPSGQSLRAHRSSPQVLTARRMSHKNEFTRTPCSTET